MSNPIEEQMVIIREVLGDIREYITPWIVFINKDPMEMKKIISQEYLENNQTFVLFVDTTPREKIESEFPDYTSILKAFPDSSRVVDKAFWAGEIMNPDEEDYWKLCDIVDRGWGMRCDSEIQVID